ncbi:unnamed protein product [Amoebophrya sp. A25]|nr:unnamed protein product [Amoebophrya sp. A25]|eukprot:GSA25T00021776001.1
MMVLLQDQHQKKLKMMLGSSSNCSSRRFSTSSCFLEVVVVRAVVVWAVCGQAVFAFAGGRERARLMYQETTATPQGGGIHQMVYQHRAGSSAGQQQNPWETGFFQHDLGQEQKLQGYPYQQNHQPAQPSRQAQLYSSSQQMMYATGPQAMYSQQEQLQELQGPQAAMYFQQPVASMVHSKKTSASSYQHDPNMQQGLPPVYYNNSSIASASVQAHQMETHGDRIWHGPQEHNSRPMLSLSSASSSGAPWPHTELGLTLSMLADAQRRLDCLQLLTQDQHARVQLLQQGIFNTNTAGVDTPAPPVPGPAFSAAEMRLVQQQQQGLQLSSQSQSMMAVQPPQLEQEYYSPSTTIDGRRHDHYEEDTNSAEKQMESRLSLISQKVFSAPTQSLQPQGQHRSEILGAMPGQYQHQQQQHQQSEEVGAGAQLLPRAGTAHASSSSSSSSEEFQRQNAELQQQTLSAQRVQEQQRKLQQCPQSHCQHLQRHQQEHHRRTGEQPQGHQNVRGQPQRTQQGQEHLPRDKPSRETGPNGKALVAKHEPAKMRPSKSSELQPSAGPPSTRQGLSASGSVKKTQQQQVDQPSYHSPHVQGAAKSAPEGPQGATSNLGAPFPQQHEHVHDASDADSVSLPKSKNVPTQYHEQAQEKLGAESGEHSQSSLYSESSHPEGPEFSQRRGRLYRGPSKRLRSITLATIVEEASPRSSEDRRSGSSSSRSKELLTPATPTAEQQLKSSVTATSARSTSASASAASSSNPALGYSSSSPLSTQKKKGQRLDRFHGFSLVGEADSDEADERGSGIFRNSSTKASASAERTTSQPPPLQDAAELEKSTPGASSANRRGPVAVLELERKSSASKSEEHLQGRTLPRSDRHKVEMTTLPVNDNTRVLETPCSPTVGVEETPSTPSCSSARARPTLSPSRRQQLVECMRKKSKDSSGKRKDKSPQRTIGIMIPQIAPDAGQSGARVRTCSPIAEEVPSPVSVADEQSSGKAVDFVSMVNMVEGSEILERRKKTGRNKISGRVAAHGVSVNESGETDVGKGKEDGHGLEFGPVAEGPKDVVSTKSASSPSSTSQASGTSSPCYRFFQPYGVHLHVRSRCAFAPFSKNFSCGKLCPLMCLQPPIDEIFDAAKMEMEDAVEEMVEDDHDGLHDRDQALRGMCKTTTVEEAARPSTTTTPEQDLRLTRPERGRGTSEQAPVATTGDQEARAIATLEGSSTLEGRSSATVQQQPAASTQQEAPAASPQKLASPSEEISHDLADYDLVGEDDEEEEQEQETSTTTEGRRRSDRDSAGRVRRMLQRTKRRDRNLQAKSGAAKRGQCGPGGGAVILVSPITKKRCTSFDTTSEQRGALTLTSTLTSGCSTSRGKDHGGVVVSALDGGDVVLPDVCTGA